MKGTAAIFVSSTSPMEYLSSCSPGFTVSSLVLKQWTAIYYRQFPRSTSGF